MNQINAGTLTDFLTSIVAKHQKIERGPFEETNSKKVSQCQKTARGDSLVSSGILCYAEKQEKRFWFSSLGQMVQFDTILFRRTFVELFFVWIENKELLQ